MSLQSGWSCSTQKSSVTVNAIGGDWVPGQIVFPAIADTGDGDNPRQAARA